MLPSTAMPRRDPVELDSPRGRFPRWNGGRCAPNGAARRPFRIPEGGILINSITKKKSPTFRDVFLCTAGDGYFLKPEQVLTQREKINEITFDKCSKNPERFG